MRERYARGKEIILETASEDQKLECVYALHGYELREGKWLGQGLKKWRYD